MLLWAALALAQAPPAPPNTETADADGGDDVYHVTVYDELAVDLARDALLGELSNAGYTREVQRDGYLVRRHPDVWRGEVRVYDDGWVHAKRQPVQFRPPGDGLLAKASCVLLLPCVRMGGQSVGRRKFRHQRDLVAGYVGPEVSALGDRVADRETEGRVSALPDRLEALWYDGVPLTEGGASLGTPQAKKAALLAYWDARTDTVWGDRVRLAVEAFLRAEVQHSATPLTPEEVTAFNAARRCERALDLTSDWDTVSRDLLERR